MTEIETQLAQLREQIAQMPTPHEYLTTEQAAEVLGLRPQSLFQWRRERTGPPFIQTSSKFVRYRRADLDAWAEKHLVK